MSNLIIDDKELKILESSIDLWHDEKVEECNHAKQQLEVLTKVKESICNPSSDGSDNSLDIPGGMFMGPMNMLKDHPEIIDGIIKQTESRLNDPFVYKEIAFKMIKKIHTINKFLKDFDTLELNKIKNEIKDLIK